MQPVIAYHVIFSTYGFWLPNDPRGSGSSTVRAEHLRPFGPAQKVTGPRSVAGKSHDRQLRLAAKTALKLPEVYLNGHQALSIANGFGDAVAKSGYVIHACSVLPQHMHLVIARHTYSIEQVGRLLKQAGTNRLLADGLHPFAEWRDGMGKLPSIWARDFRHVFLFTPDDIRSRIKYVEDNPAKDGKRRQFWPFVVPYAG